MTPGLAGFIASGHDGRAWDESVAGALEALRTAFDVIPDRSGKPAACRRTWLDTFDWRLHRAGLTLEYAGRPRGGELLLTGDAARAASAPSPASAPSTVSATNSANAANPADPAAISQPVIGWQAARPHPMCELPDGPVASRIGDLVAPRALLPVVTVTSTTTTHRLLNEDGKTVARLLVERASIPGPEPTPLAPRLEITEVRGYPGAARTAARLLGAAARHRAGHRAHGNGSAARGWPPARRLLQQGRRGHHRRPARQPGGRDDPAPAARHRRGEHRRRSRRHRYRVPARPARLGATHPQRPEAVRRRADRPGRSDRGRLRVLRGRVQVGRRPDHADQGPGRAPARLRRHRPLAQRGQAGRPRAVPRLPGAAPTPGVPAARPRPEVGSVHRADQGLAGQADHDQRRRSEDQSRRGPFGQGQRSRRGDHRRPGDGANPRRLCQDRPTGRGDHPRVTRQKPCTTCASEPRSCGTRWSSSPRCTTGRPRPRWSASSNGCRTAWASSRTPRCRSGRSGRWRRRCWRRARRRPSRCWRWERSRPGSRFGSGPRGKTLVAGSRRLPGSTGSAGYRRCCGGNRGGS